MTKIHKLINSCANKKSKVVIDSQFKDLLLQGIDGTKFDIYDISSVNIFDTYDAFIIDQSSVQSGKIENLYKRFLCNIYVIDDVSSSMIHDQEYWTGLRSLCEYYNTNYHSTFVAINNEAYTMGQCHNFLIDLNTNNDWNSIL